MRSLPAGGSRSCPSRTTSTIRNAIGVWDDHRRLQAGYVPAEIARELEADDWQAVSLWEFFEDGQRGGLRVLLAPRDAWIGLPRA